MTEYYQPKGTYFLDAQLGEMVLVGDDEPQKIWRGWLCKKGPDGQWVSYRKATAEDIEKIDALPGDCYFGNLRDNEELSRGQK